MYYGTDTRATGLLVGASLAIGIALARAGGHHSPPARRHQARGVAALVALAMILVAMNHATGGSSWLFPLGFIGVDLAVASVIAAIVLVPDSLVARLFSVPPLRAVGIISYGLYLWHFPCFLWLDQSSTGLSGDPLLVARLMVTLVVALVSFVAIEQPVRRRKVPPRILRLLVPAAVAGSVGALISAVAVGAEIQVLECFHERLVRRLRSSSQRPASTSVPFCARRARTR